MRRCVVAAIAVLLAGSASGGIEHTILHGVSLGRVKAWVAPDHVPSLTSARIQAAAEDRLSQGGVVLKPGAEAVLFIGATPVLSPTGDCVVYVEARLLEGATLERNRHHVEASSWSRTGVVAGQPSNCAGNTDKAAGELVDDFIEHYRAMNPARAAD